jgi:DnaJ-class molecular chaperone
MPNLYDTLGVRSNAPADEIKRAYRRLASQHHPDKGGDKSRFQEIQQAYDTLSDPGRRAAYDNPQPQFHNFGFQGQTPFDFQTIFDVFGTRFQQANQTRPQQARMSLWVTLQDVAQTTRKTISVGTPQGTQVLEIDIPAGINDGDTVQYPGLGPAGMDLMITYRIHPNPRWSRQGANLTTEQVVTVWDLIQGADVVVRDILGYTLSLTIPPRTQPGTVFRLRGRGLAQRGAPAGDLLVRVQATIPDHIDPVILAAIAGTNK